MRLAQVLVVVVALAATGCDSSTSPEPAPSPAADAGRNDAAPAEGPATGNALGQTCSGAEDCPTEPPHTCVFLQAGNPLVGYCSPSCAVNTDCSDGYVGPTGGAPTCFVPGAEDACSILCGASEDCPANLECKITGGPVNVCGTI